MVNSTVYYLLVLTWGYRYFWKEGTSEKGCVEIENWGTSVHFLLGFKKISFTLHIYVLVKIFQNGADFIQKLTSGFKNQMRNLDNFRQAVWSPKSWNLIGYFYPKNAFSQLRNYIMKIYLTLLSTICVKTHQILQTKSQFFPKFGWLISVMRDNSSALFQLKLYMLLTKVVHQSANF